MNILFLTSPAPAKSGFWTTEKRPPIGLGYLMAVLKQAGHVIHFSDEYLCPTDILDTDFLKTNNIDFVGIYSNTVCYQSTLQLLEKLELQRKTKAWGGKILIGGPHTSVGYKEIPAYVDHIVIGEGEVTVPKIIAGEVKERVVVGEPVTDLDSLPRPAWEVFVDLPYDWKHSWHEAVPLFTFNTSRGCPFSCSFCSVKAIWGRTYRYMSAERVVQDIEFVVQNYGAKTIYFREDHFTLNKERTTRFCELLIEKQLGVEWICETRADLLTDYSYQKLMHDAGCRAFYIGVESGSPKMLEFYKKQIHLDEVEKTFNIAREVGIKTYASLIFGFPTETSEDVQMTNDLMEKLKPDFIGRNVFVGLPGSECYDYIKRNKLYEFEDENHIVYPLNYLENIKKYYSDKEYFHTYTSNMKIDWVATGKETIWLNDGTNPLVSVVMSVYNAEDYLAESISSILTQTFRDFEFIIINDGSTDRTKEILESYPDNRIILVHQENTGLTKALNKGISLARGRYIARQDADDVSKPQRLELQVAYMETHQDVGLLGSRFEFIDKDGKVIRPSLLPTDDSALRSRLPMMNQFCHASVIIRREALEKVGTFRDFFVYAQDYDLWLRISEHYKIGNLHELLVQYRELPDAISSDKILLQSRYASIASELAQQRISTGKDALAEEKTIALPSATALSQDLQQKLTDYYSNNPMQMIDGLLHQDSSADLSFLFSKICAERTETKRQLILNQELVHKTEAQVEEMRSIIQKRVSEIAELNLILENKQSEIARKDEQIFDLLHSWSWKLTKPLRYLLSKLKQPKSGPFIA